MKVPPLQKSSDGDLYAAVHLVLESERARDTAERRGGPRHPYPYTQLIGPIVDGELPNQSQFRHVQCDDISSSGMAYLAEDVPRSDELIVVLGKVPFLFLRARIVRHDQVVHSGKIMYRIACRFVERIDSVRPADRATLESAINEATSRASI